MKKKTYLTEIDFTSDQLFYIISGFRMGLDKDKIAIYSNPKLASLDMDLILEGLHSGLTIGQIVLFCKEDIRRQRNSNDWGRYWYKKPKTEDEQMKQAAITWAEIRYREEDSHGILYVREACKRIQSFYDEKLSGDVEENSDPCRILDSMDCMRKRSTAMGRLHNKYGRDVYFYTLRELPFDRETIVVLKNNHIFAPVQLLDLDKIVHILKGEENSDHYEKMREQMISFIEEFFEEEADAYKKIIESKCTAKADYTTTTNEFGSL